MITYNIAIKEVSGAAVQVDINAPQTTASPNEIEVAKMLKHHLLLFSEEVHAKVLNQWTSPGQIKTN